MGIFAFGDACKIASCHLREALAARGLQLLSGELQRHRAERGSQPISGESSGIRQRRTCFY